MADKSTTGESEAPKKPVKRVIVIQDDDAVSDNTVSNVSEPKKITVEGDTPPVKDEKELEEIAEKIQETTDVASEDDPHSEVSTESSEELPKDITVGEALKIVEEETDEEAVPSDTDSDLTPEETASPNEAADTVDSSEPDESLPEASEETPLEPTAIAEKEEYSDSTTEKAVDDIVATESDELLAREDAAKEDELSVKNVSKGSKKERLKTFLKIPAVRWGIVTGLVLILLVIAVLPGSRYAILNAAGVRAGSSLTVINDDNQQPLKNAEVTIGDQKKNTDDKGVVEFTGLKLGKTQVKVNKRGYGAVEQSRTLGWGSNPLGQVKLTVTGSQFTFVVNDFLSNKSVMGAEAVSGEFNAQSDLDGKILLPLDSTSDGDVEVTIKATDYREQKITIKTSDTSEKNVLLVPSKQHVFISKRTGKYDVYKIDADGTNESILMAATGSEREDLAVLAHPTKEYVAIVSTREGKRNKDGYLMSNLFVVNVKTGEATKLPQSERIQLVDWTGDRIVYIAVTEGASAANAARSKLFSFEIGQPGAKEIASANYFNDAIIFRDAVYYAPSSYSIPVGNVKYYRINPDGSSQVALLDIEVWNIFRSDYDTLLLSVQQDWYEQKAAGQPTKLTNAPANPRNRIYRESPDKKRALWIDVRDGKGVLISYDTEAKKEDTLQTQAGLVLPVSWLNNTTYVYRISDNREVADYVKSTEGGEAKKLRDVTNTELYNYFNY